MIFFGENKSGRFQLPEAASVVINCELDVPADDMTVTFPVSDFPPLWRIYAACDGSPVPGESMEGVCFCGVVDEQITSGDGAVYTTTICARSPAALPLDSECEYGEYVNPSLEVMTSRHLAPFGIASDSAPAQTLRGTMTVARGRSHYYAVRRFCSIFLGTVPRIDSLGRFRPDVRLGGEAIIFSPVTHGHNVQNRRLFTRLTVKQRRYSLISRVTAETGEKPAVVTDAKAASDGITRERRISLPNSRTGTLSDADELIRKGRAASFEAELLCHGFLGDIVGRRAVLEAQGLEKTALIVTKTRYTGSAGTQTTRVTLAPQEVL